MTTLALVIAFMSPLVLALAAFAYFTVRLLLLRWRRKDTASDYVRDFLGPLAPLVRTDQPDAERKLFGRMLISAAIFVGYATGLMWFTG